MTKKKEVKQVYKPCKFQYKQVVKITQGFYKGYYGKIYERKKYLDGDWGYYMNISKTPKFHIFSKTDKVFEDNISEYHPEYEYLINDLNHYVTTNNFINIMSVLLFIFLFLVLFSFWRILL